MSMTPALLCC